MVSEFLLAVLASRHEANPGKLLHLIAVAMKINKYNFSRICKYSVEQLSSSGVQFRINLIKPDDEGSKCETKYMH